MPRKQKNIAHTGSAGKKPSLTNPKVLKGSVSQVTAKESLRPKSFSRHEARAQPSVAAPPKATSKRASGQHEKPIKGQHRYSLRQTRQRQADTVTQRSFPKSKSSTKLQAVTEQTDLSNDSGEPVDTIEPFLDLNYAHNREVVLDTPGSFDLNQRLPSCSQEQLELIQAVLDEPRLGERIMAASRGIRMQLEKHRNVNVDMEGVLDPRSDQIRKTKSSLPEGCKDEAPIDILTSWWTRDWQKCKGNNEAVFQRTLMIQMIDRHRLFLHNSLAPSEFCDFSVEQDWMCPGMPTRGVLEPEPVDVPKMRPDLCVSFFTKAVLDLEDTTFFPDALGELIFFEGPSRTQRAFPFLIIEAKASYQSPDNEQAFLQSLNYASQALHILYEFLRETNPRCQVTERGYLKGEYEVQFFEWVRVFTAVATSKGVVIRSHRAVEILNGQRGRIVGNYPLRFEHSKFEEFNDGRCNFDRANVVRTFEFIIWAYGKRLMDLLRKAGSAIARKFEARPELRATRTMTHYRHGMPIKQRNTKTVGQSRESSASVYGSNELAIARNQEIRGYSPAAAGLTSAQSSFGLGKRLNVSETSPAKRKK